MRPRSRRGLGRVVWVGVMLVALMGALGVSTSRAGAQSPLEVVITGADLDWSVSNSGSMTWIGFGSRVSEDPKCRLYSIGGPVTSIRFELQFDLGDDPPTLTGTLSGTMEWQNPAVQDPAYGQEWASGSFSGPIVDGWAREAGEGWAWGGNADLTLEFAGARICSIFLDESGAEDYLVAEGNGQRQVTVRFVGGPGAYGEDSGFSLDGSVGTWEEGEDSWGIALGCNGCDIPLPLLVDPGETTGGDAGESPSGSESVLGMPPWVLGGPPVGDGGVFSAQSGEGGAGSEGGWDPAGVAILIMFLIFVLLAAGLPLKAAVAAVLVGLRPGPARPTAGETASLARNVQLTWSGDQSTVTVASPVQPWSSPSTGAPPAEFVLQPGQPYTMSGGTGAGPNDWVQVTQGRNVGWVHRSTVQDWHQEQIVKPHWPTAGAYRETVNFPQGPDVRPPGGVNYTRQPPGNYDLGPPGTDGHRPVYDWEGNLIGSTPADKAPPPSLRKNIAPPPLPPAPPPAP